MLQSLATTTNRQRSELADIRDRTQQQLADLDTLLVHKSQLQAQLETWTEVIEDLPWLHIVARSHSSHANLDPGLFKLIYVSGLSLQTVIFYNNCYANSFA